MTDRTMRQSAANLAAQIQSEDGILLMQLLSYRKSKIVALFANNRYSTGGIQKGASHF
jgi:hypothetical protein